MLNYVLIDRVGESLLIPISNVEKITSKNVAEKEEEVDLEFKILLKNGILYTNQEIRMKTILALNDIFRSDL